MRNPAKKSDRDYERVREFLNRKRIKIGREDFGWIVAGIMFIIMLITSLF